MADQEVKTEAKAPIIVTPQELAAMYDRLHAREWNEEKNDEGKTVKQGTAYKNPTNVMRTLVNYGRVGALRIVDAFARLTGAEGAIRALEGRVAALEAGRAADEAQQGAAIEAAIAQIATLPPDEADAARAQLAGLMDQPGIPAAVRAKITAALAPPPPAPKPAEPAAVEAKPPAADAAVLTIKPKKAKDQPAGGGAA